jgi:murein DD-endopeptidase MepM/ murein hydrolase activator NlpD
MLKGIRIFLYFLVVCSVVLTAYSYRYLKAASKKPVLEKITRQKKIRGKILRAQPLYNSLLSCGLSPRQIEELITALKPIFNFKSVYPGDTYVVSLNPDNTIQKFVYERGVLETYRLERKGGRLVAKKEVHPFMTRLKVVEGEIKEKDSLFASIARAGETDTLTLNFANIFLWDIDFYTDPRPGDRYQILVEKIYVKGKFFKYGRLLWAKYEGKKKEFVAIFYQDPAGRKGYYTPEGKSLKKRFLKSPLKFRRISSYYSHRRYHPVYKIYRPHLGIDYAAPVGTPVKAVADGRIVYAGWKRGFGRYIKIRHINGIYTTYGHLSRFRKGIRRGKYVKQGTVIGYVGQTGVATGPHLDYRVIKNKRYINPLSVNLPAAPPVRRKYLNDFKRWQKELEKKFKEAEKLATPIVKK